MIENIKETEPSLKEDEKVKSQANSSKHYIYIGAFIAVATLLIVGAICMTKNTTKPVKEEPSLGAYYDVSQQYQEKKLPKKIMKFVDEKKTKEGYYSYLETNKKETYLLFTAGEIKPENTTYYQYSIEDIAKNKKKKESTVVFHKIPYEITENMRDMTTPVILLKLKSTDKVIFEEKNNTTIIKSSEE
ncbi:MAG: hypothetical protein RSC93_04315 [Erysipelotrichaceae bacterium]